ncbi:helix-turn-helix transcriptional regulator, partial [Piscirickettsia salmonis]|uniref:helix-turn-helix transcriptional regulator n=1 Tax=Piscirickettsia salmonis TaxID=1238 RepID=UPI003EC0BF00
CIEVNNRRFFLSNNSPEVIIPYHLRGYSNIDTSFEAGKEAKKSFFFPCRPRHHNDNKITNPFLDILENEFKIFNRYGIIKAADGYIITAIVGSKNTVRNQLLFYKQTHYELEKFIIAFIKEFKDVIIDNFKGLKFSKIYKNPHFLNSLVHQEIPRYYDEPKEYELECLYWYKEGNNASQIAKITGYSPNTVKSYLKEVREKMRVETTREAMIMAIQHGLIC